MKSRSITVFGLGILISAISFSSSVMAATQIGIASVYSDEKTANGEYAHASALTAAHRTLPFGTLVEVTNNETGRSVVVRINDRGPYIRGRVIDLTPAGARAIGSSGLAPVTLTVLSVGTRRASRSDRSI
jgi:rare lipoprotein A